MNKIIDFQTNKEHYHAQACIVWCFDNRFTPALNEFIKNKNYQHYDLVEVAGGAKSLASPEKEFEEEYILKQIEISLKLHHAQRIILMNHSDCGAYGGLKNFENNEAKEKEEHAKELSMAKEFLQKNLSSQVPIDLIFVDFTGIYEV
jgi:carbonic anhydrase